MTEARIAFLYKAASLLSTANMNKTQEKLKSYYRMRCKEISKGYGLPLKHFSEQIICTHCCLEWKKDTQIKTQSIKLTKRQRKRIKSQSKMSKYDSQIHLLNSIEIEKTCTFCGNKNKTMALQSNKSVAIKLEPSLKSKDITKKAIQEVQTKNNQTCDVYSNTAQVFSLNNKKNTLKSTIKETKIIKNNKKKKDKYAGLCKKAVLLSAQLRQEKERQNVMEEKAKQTKLGLFLKPSS